MTAHLVHAAVSYPSSALLRLQSDERLVALIREGSQFAFATLVERHRSAVLRACRCVLADDRAEDSTQQTLLCAWDALRRGDEVRDVRAWLLRIARNTALNALRVRGYDYQELRDSMRLSDAPEEELERREVMRRTLAGLAALPERQREALLLSAVDGVPHAAIARELGLSEGAARQLVRRARNTLRLAASAVAPLPVVRWLANHPVRAEQARSLSELLGEGAPVGAGALIAKMGAVAVVAGGVVTTPAVVPRIADQARGASPPAASVDIGALSPRVMAPADAITADAHPVTRDQLLRRGPARQRFATSPAAPGTAKRDAPAAVQGGDGERRPIENSDVERQSLSPAGSETADEVTTGSEAVQAHAAAQGDELSDDTPQAAPYEPSVDSVEPDPAASVQQSSVPDPAVEEVDDHAGEVVG